MTGAEIRRRVTYWLKRFELAPSVQVVVCHGLTLEGETAEARLSWHNHRNQHRFTIPDGYDEHGTDWRIVHEVTHSALLEMTELQRLMMNGMPRAKREFVEQALLEAEERLCCRVATALVGPLPFPE